MKTCPISLYHDYQQKLIKESICSDWKPGDDPELKHDFMEVYGYELWDAMEDMYEAFPFSLGYGTDVDYIDGSSWEISLIQERGVEYIKLAIDSVFSATESNLNEKSKMYPGFLLDRVEDYRKLPRRYRPGISAETESRWFSAFFPDDLFVNIAKILERGFPKGSSISPIPVYAEQREINIHDVPTNSYEAEEFICGFSASCGSNDDLVSDLDWDEDSLVEPRKIFELKFTVYLPVITPEIEQLLERDEETGLPGDYLW